MSHADSSPPMSERPSQTFPKTVRLRKSDEFKSVYALRQSAADGLLIVNGRENGLGHARLGLTVSRRVGNAVTRNRWKRCLREAFRQIRTRLPTLDLVVTPRPGASPGVTEAIRSLTSLARKVENRIQTGAPPYEPRGRRQPSQTKTAKNPGARSRGQKSQPGNQDSPP